MSFGFEAAGINVVLAVDSNPLNTTYHRRNFPFCTTITGDLAKISASDLRRYPRLGRKRIDVLFGGPPCEGFSVGGKRKTGDARNLLLHHFARFVGELRPRYFVVENVEGLTYKTGRPILERFLASVRRHGYRHVVPIAALDAQDFGVPQRRKRVFILGYRRGFKRPRYPKSRSGRARPSVWDAIGDLPDLNAHKELFSEDVWIGRLRAPSVYARSLRESVNGSRVSLTGCLNTRHDAAIRARFRKTTPGQFEPISRFFRLAKRGVASTLRAGSGPAYGSFTAPRPIHPVHPRCISVREAARLHSFPDSFRFHPSRWHGFRQIGSSVPPKLARTIAQSVIAALKASRRSKSTRGKANG